MKILMYEPIGKGGLSPYTTSLVHAIARNNVRVSLATSSNYDGHNNKIDIISRMKPMSRNIWVRKFKSIWALDRFYKSLFNAYTRNSISDEVKPDIVHLQVTVPLVDQFLLPLLARRVKTILTVHDVIWHNPKNLNNKRIILKKVYNSVDHIIVHTQKNKAQLINEFDIGADNITVIPHGIDTLPVKAVNPGELRQMFGIRDKVPVILFYGGIRANKGLELLLQAMHLLKKEHMPATLVVAGGMPPGETFEHYDKIIEELQLRNNVVLHIKWINADEVHAYFEVADIVVLPYTSFASQSGVLLQAYKYGKPVVVTNMGGMEEIVKEDCAGRIVEPTFRSIADGIKYLLNDSEYYNNAIRNMTKAVNEKYDWDIVAIQTIRTYEKVVLGGNHAV